MAKSSNGPLRDTFHGHTLPQMPALIAWSHTNSTIMTANAKIVAENDALEDLLFANGSISKRDQEARIRDFLDRLRATIAGDDDPRNFLSADSDVPQVEGVSDASILVRLRRRHQSLNLDPLTR